MLKKTFVFCAMIGIVALALASSGGGKNRNSSIVKPEFSPLKTSSGNSLFLRSSVPYSGSIISSSKKSEGGISYRNLNSYQKGNTIYVLPSNFKLTTKAKPTFKSNLNVVDVKIKLCK